MLTNHKYIFAYIPAHFIVDFSCAFLLFKILHNSEQWYLCLLLYNFCAFALQMPVGLIADRLNKNALCAAIGCCLIACSFYLGPFAILASIIAGIGNSMFHIGGGIDVLNTSIKNPSILGLYVSPGALGIYLGTLLGKQKDALVWPVILVLILTAFIILASCYADRHSFQTDNSPVSFPDKFSYDLLLALGCIFAVVCLRSYLGMIMNFSWKSITLWSSILILAVVFGKITGGFLIQWFGSRKTSLLSLGIAAVMFLFSGNPVIGILAVFLFNMTMPITLWAMAKLLSGSKGFSFGLLTFGLFIGFIPTYLEMPPLFTTLSGFALAAVISLIFLLTGLRKVEFL